MDHGHVGPRPVRPGLRAHASTGGTGWPPPAPGPLAGPAPRRHSLPRVLAPRGHRAPPPRLGDARRGRRGHRARRLPRHRRPHRRVRRGDAAPVVTSTTDDPDWASVAAAVTPSVVAIDVRTAEGAGAGSGVILDGEGHILTNDHVVGDAVDGGIRVTLSDGRIFSATVAGLDPATDLAVITLDSPPDDLQPATFGDSDDVLVGDPVVAVGNPLGLSSTVTTGIVSALDRPVSTTEAPQAFGQPGTTVVTNAIQVDAAINPGNSGGPLFDAGGRVIGINSSIASMSGATGGAVGNIGLGFAIPVNLAAQVADQLIADGVAEHAYLGVSLSDGTATIGDTMRAGAEVRQVEPGTPAAEAGVRAGDVIVAVGEDQVNGAESLTGFVRQHEAGDEVTLTVVRGGSEIELPATLAAREDA